MASRTRGWRRAQGRWDAVGGAGGTGSGRAPGMASYVCAGPAVRPQRARLCLGCAGQSSGDSPQLGAAGHGRGAFDDGGRGMGSGRPATPPDRRRGAPPCGHRMDRAATSAGAGGCDPRPSLDSGPLGLDAFRAGYIEVAGCAPPPELRVVTAPDNLDTARAVGERYEAATAARDHGCPEAAVSVFPLDSRIVASHAASPTGWWDPVAGLTELGPQPDLWLTSTWAEMAPEVRTGTALAEAAPRLVATTPVVVGLPSTSPIGTSQLNSMPWAADFQSLVGAGELVARPDPETPGTGPVATTLLYGQGDPASPARVERALAGGRPQGGIPAGDSVAQICAYRRSITPGGFPTGSPQARTAVITTEQEISRLDRGDPLGTFVPRRGVGRVDPGHPPRGRVPQRHPGSRLPRGAARLAGQRAGSGSCEYDECAGLRGERVRGLARVGRRT